MNSKERYFVLERSFYRYRVNVYIYDRHNQIIKVISENDELGKLQKPGNEVVEQLFLGCKQKIYALTVAPQSNICYLGIYAKEDGMCIFGPFTLNKISQKSMQEYRHRQGIKNKNYVLPVISLSILLNFISCMVYTLTGKMCTEQEVLQNFGEISAVEEPELDIYEYSRDYEDRQRLAYKVEQQWVSDVERGIFHRESVELTTDNLEKLEQIGTLAKGNSLKQLEYMVITTICLASRAAIRGGMNPYEAYMLSDLYYQKVADCTSPFELIQVYQKVANDFSDHVKMVQTEHLHGGYVEQCKEYIARNRNKKISIEKMAKEFGVSRSHLSRVFSEQTGKTIREYIIEKRLQAATNMLRYSDFGLSEISDYLCFNSQSYFGVQFRKKYGLTPMEYRKKYHIHDFDEMNQEL